MEQTVVNSDGSVTFPIGINDSSATALDRAASNADGSSEASADTGILRAKATANGPGPATQHLDQIGNASFTDSYIIHSTSAGPVHVTIPMLVDGSIPEAHANPFGFGTAGFSVSVIVEAATGNQPGGSTTDKFFTDNTPNGTSTTPCRDVGVGTDICQHTSSYDYTSANAFSGTVEIGFDIDANTPFFIQTQLGVDASSWLPLGAPASSDFFSTAVFGGFVVPDGDTVSSGLAGPLTERDGAFNYPSVLAYLDGLTAVPEPGSLGLLGAGLLGMAISRRRRAARNTVSSS